MLKIVITVKNVLQHRTIPKNQKFPKQKLKTNLIKKKNNKKLLKNKHVRNKKNRQPRLIQLKTIIRDCAVSNKGNLR